MKVLSIEQMTRLKGLGVDTSKASMCYVVFACDGVRYEQLVINEESLYGPSQFANRIPTFTLQDVIELLPKIIHVDHIECYLVILQAVDGFFVQYSEKDCLEDDIIWFYNENILDAAYNMLIWVIENGHLKTK